MLQDKRNSTIGKDDVLFCALSGGIYDGAETMGGHWVQPVGNGIGASDRELYTGDLEIDLPI